MILSTEALEKQNKKLSLLYDLALTVSKSLDLKTILDDVLEKIIAFMGVDAGVIYVIDEETLEMIPVSFKNLSDEVVRDLCENRVKVGECMCGSIAQFEREVIILKEASKDPRFTRETLKREGMEFYAGLPLKSKDKVVGVLCVITHKPYSIDEESLDILRAATVPIALAVENAMLFENTKRQAEAKKKYYNFEGIIATSPKMKDVLNIVRKITDVSSTVLIQGESGTGKELIARSIHFNSIRKDRPFIAVNCAALPETLLESELFGYVRGAFTGAYTDKKGLLEAADGGTLFLDEIGAMSKNLQVKLLRFLQEREFYKVGSTRPVSVDVRIIAATNQSLEEAVKSKQFREDLYFRINVIKIELPPLRERIEDIPLLVRYFMNRFSKKMGKKMRRISNEAMDALIKYPWPGNIRELKNTIERAMVIAEADEIWLEDLPPEITVYSNMTKEDLSLRRAIRVMEMAHIQRVLNLVGGNKKKAAHLLGIDTATLWRKLRNISTP